MEDSQETAMHLKKVEQGIEKVEQGMISKTLTSNKAIIVQTLALVVTLVGLAIAAERRITTVELKAVYEAEARVKQDEAMMNTIKELQAQTKLLSENQVRVVTILDVIDKRHSLEDSRRIAKIDPIKQ